MVPTTQRLMKRLAIRRKVARIIPRALFEALENRRLLSGYVLSSLASFNGGDGEHPLGALIMDSSGDLYGTTLDGGANNSGAVFEIAKGSTSVTTLASFSGEVPIGTLLMDADGNLYGIAGGVYGSVFEIVNGSGVITTLADFDVNSGQIPSGGLVMDSSGNLFGTTEQGGADDDGTVYEVAAGSDAITTLAIFNGPDGRDPQGPLMMDSAGNLYGTTEFGGGTTTAAGAVFELASGSTTITKLATFDGIDGANPEGALIMDSAGNFYGTAHSGGPLTSAGVSRSLGEVFELARGRKVITDLAGFNVTNGQNPNATLVMDSSGDLFGTTPLGGANNFGTAFEIVNGSDIITTVANLDGTNGSSAFGGLIFDSAGNLYGTASGGGASHDGAVFELSPNPAAQVAFTSLPTTTSVDANVIPPITVSVEDASGNVVATDDSTVMLTIASGPAGATLLGDVSATAVDGVATFDQLSVNRPGAYTLTATDGILPTVPAANGIVPTVPVANTAIPTATSGSFLVPSNTPPSTVVPTFDHVVLPASVVAGATLNARALVAFTNNGSELKGTYTVNLFVDTSTALSGAQALNSTASRLLALNTGRAATVNFTLKPLPSTLPAGIYMLVAQVIDPTGATNLIASSQTIQVVAPIVGLAVSAGPVVPATLNVDLSGSIQVTVVNDGNVAATGLLDFTLSPSSDGTSALAGDTLASLVIRPATIAAGKSRTVILNFTPTTLSPGTYYSYLSVSLDGYTAVKVGPQFTVA